MKVLIKGAGDLASGIACRLHHSGMDVVMTEIGVPTTVRRTVAFSPAIYEKRAEVEEIEGVRCDSLEKLILAVAQRKIPVLEDPECQLAMGVEAGCGGGRDHCQEKSGNQNHGREDRHWRGAWIYGWCGLSLCGGDETWT